MRPRWTTPGGSRPARPAPTPPPSARSRRAAAISRPRSRPSGRRSSSSSRPTIRRKACGPSSRSASRGSRAVSVRVRQATPDDVPALVALFQELDRMQADWRVFTPRPGLYDEVGAKYREALGDPDQVVLVAEDAEGEVDGMAIRGARPPSRLSDARALETS